MKSTPYAQKYFTDELQSIWIITCVIVYCALSFIINYQGAQHLFWSPLPKVSGVLAFSYSIILFFYIRGEKNWSRLNRLMLFTSITFSVFLAYGLANGGYNPHIPWFFMVFLLIFSSYFNTEKDVLICALSGILPMVLAHFIIRNEIVCWEVFPIYSILYVIGVNWVLSKAFKHKKRFNEKNKELEFKHQEVETILNSIKALIAYKDKENRFINVNDAFAQRLGRSRSEVIGISLYDLISYEQARKFHDEDLETIANGTAQLNVLEHVYLPDGVSNLWLRSNKTPFVDTKGDVVGIIVHSEDITEEMEARKLLQESEHQLTAYSRQLEESNQNLQEFAYVISHDLREPLRTVTAYTQLLKRQLKPEDQTQNIQDFMHFIVDAAKRMDGQINGILEYSRVGRSDLNLENLSLHNVVDTVKRILYLQINETNATIELEAEDLMLYGDKMQITQLFQNLVSNSLKYKKSDVAPVVKILATLINEIPQISIADNGIGIEAQYHENIFGVFRRLHTHVDVEGSGIGLSICRRILQRHQGKIRVESVFGVGTTFIFTLPNPDVLGK
jgi:PAS domain S-box-containing protein